MKKGRKFYENENLKMQKMQVQILEKQLKNKRKLLNKKMMKLVIEQKVQLQILQKIQQIQKKMKIKQIQRKKKPQLKQKQQLMLQKIHK